MARMAPRVLIVSNGHGEDAIGAALARAIETLQPGAHISAYPLVGRGTAYEGVVAGIDGPRRALPADGLTLHSPANLVADLRAGWIGMTVRQGSDLFRCDTDALLVVGDLYAQLFASAVSAHARYVYQPLVSIRQTGPTLPPLHRWAMERITPLEQLLLARRTHRVYVRDEPTALWLRSRGVPHAVALGNPAVDDVADVRAGSITEPASERLRLALLPGSRAHAHRSLAVMLDAVDRLKADATVAWARPEPPAVAGWAWESEGASASGRGMLTRGGSRIATSFRGLARSLQGAHLALGTTGTASEQAAAAGVPVISFPVPPEHMPSFLAGQARLLGAALTVVKPDAGAVAAAARELTADAGRYAEAVRAGRERMGAPGATSRIAADLVADASRRGVW